LLSKEFIITTHLKKKMTKILNSESIVANGYNRVAEKYYEHFKPCESNHLPILQELVKRLPDHAIILDAGCGAGIPVAKFLSDQQFNVTGIDIAETMLTLARKQVPLAHFQNMSLYNLQFPLQHFDAVVSFFALLHLERNRIDSVLQTIAYIIKPNRYFACSVNKGNNTEGFFDFFGEQTYFSTYTEDEFVDRLRKAGFTVVWKKQFIFTKNNHQECQMFFLAKKYNEKRK